MVEELARRLSGKAVIGADLADSDMKGADIESVAAMAVAFFDKYEGMKLLDRGTLEKIIEKLGEEKMPMQIEIIKPSGFKPEAKDIEPDFKIHSIEKGRTAATVADFSSHFRDRLARLRRIIEAGRGLPAGLINSIDKIGSYANGREVSIVGMVYDRIITKKGNVLVMLEDESGMAKVIFIKPEGFRRGADNTFEIASKIVQDEVIAVRGKVSSPFIIANSVIWPDIPVRQRKRSEERISIAFTSDIHVGSRLFMEKNFSRFIEWLNGNVDRNREMASRIKYLVIAGDVVDGIGVYPNQDKELSIGDIYKQYAVFFDFLYEIPEYIHVFVLPGNHDAVQRAEPQPELDRRLFGELKQSNIHLLSNPAYVELHGLTLLSYHGTSLDSVIQGVKGCSYSRPEGAMLELLRKRHISPIYGYNPIMPERQDPLVIERVPDILHMGHLHRNGYSEYHGTQIINSGTWQSRTSYQVKLGHLPTPAVLPVYDAAEGSVVPVDFNEA